MPASKLPTFLVEQRLKKGEDNFVVKDEDGTVLLTTSSRTQASEMQMYLTDLVTLTVQAAFHPDADISELEARLDGTGLMVHKVDPQEDRKQIDKMLEDLDALWHKARAAKAQSLADMLAELGADLLLDEEVEDGNGGKIALQAFGVKGDKSKVEDFIEMCRRLVG